MYVVYKIYFAILAHPAQLTLSPPPQFKKIQSRDSPDYEEKPKVKLDYKERYELEHTYAVMQGGRQPLRKELEYVYDFKVFYLKLLNLKTFTNQ